MASTNIFDLLTDDAQDQEIQIPAVKAAKPAPTTTANKKPAAATAPKPTTAARVNRPRDNDVPRGPRYDRVPREGEYTPHPSRGSRAPRGGRHGGYDRHSGTGIVDSEKKESNRLGDATTAPLEGERDATLAIEESAATGFEPAEPEVPVRTLDDYLQEKAAKSLKISLPEARAANSGADDSKWKDAKVLEVEDTGDFIKMGKDPVAKTRKSKKETKVLITDIEVRYSEPAREQAPRTAFRGGRGGPRGGSRGSDRTPRGDRTARGGRGGHHASFGPRSGGASVNVDDTELFPSLGSK
ncbi:hypothetical protein BG011_002017 [Mortierella polycephala]|uniref:Hyaluronan/mRNA-binding protein domain-containing protein n=1 Tax=Mortierella polycephala TaxID=41804 RepID=A0A9P6UAP4_9FUNG|nr:hypothetical protein BG011_002017 [Mortierella polycephala]